MFAHNPVVGFGEGFMRILPLLLIVGLLAQETMCAVVFAQEQLLSGPSAFGDWTQDAPGVRRLIKPSDMPPPDTSSLVAHRMQVIPRPDDVKPKAPQGFEVSLFADNLRQPRQMRVAPNGDIFVAESEAKRIRLLRARAGSPQADGLTVFAANLDRRPFGIAFYPPGPEPTHVYVATEGNVVRFPYRNGDRKSRGAAEVIVPQLPEGHHWTRDIVFSPDGITMFVSVGSGTNDAEDGIEAETDRAAILAFDPDGSHRRVYASGLRNPVAMQFHPETGDLWTTVNERDGLGDNLPPDYITRVKEGGFYGWPWYYIGNHEDPAHKGERPDLASRVDVPDVLFEAHSAALGFAAYQATAFPQEFRGNLFVAFHGSWNRSSPTGYKVVCVHLDKGQPTGEYEDFLVGFLTPSGEVWGRPVGVAVAADGALLVSDDGSGSIWRIAYSAKPR